MLFPLIPGDVAVPALAAAQPSPSAWTATQQSELRYAPYGDYRYTGQLSQMDTVGLYFYKARWYDPYLAQFTQPDSIIPDPYNPLDWNRYSYARYNPINYTDSTGHSVDCAIGEYGCRAGKVAQS